MRPRQLLLLVAPLVMIWALLANAQTYINGQLPGASSSATPFAVGTSTPVLLVAPNSARLCTVMFNWPEAGNLSCLPVASGAVAAGTVVTATNGFLFQSGRTWVELGTTGDTRLGWQCVSTSGTVNVSVQETYHCANTKTGM